MNNEHPIQRELNDFILYTSSDGKVKVEVVLYNENVWLTQKSIASLFGVKVPAISKHLKNIFDENELDEKLVISILEITTRLKKTRRYSDINNYIYKYKPLI